MNKSADMGTIEGESYGDFMLPKIPSNIPDEVVEQLKKNRLRFQTIAESRKLKYKSMDMRYWHSNYLMFINEWIPKYLEYEKQLVEKFKD